MTDLPYPIIDLHRCSGCGLCKSRCPVHAIDIRENKAVLVLPETCLYCGICEEVCPESALHLVYEIIRSNGKDISNND